MTVNSFTLKSNGGLFREIRTECEVFQPHDPVHITPAQRAALRSEKCIAVWDTGATGTVISQSLAQKLGLQPTGFAVINHAQGTSRVPKYIINIVLPNSVGFAIKEVTEGILSNCDVLIGMDIIAQGDFAITNVNGNTTFFPSSFHQSKKSTLQHRTLQFHHLPRSRLSNQRRLEETTHAHVDPVRNTRIVVANKETCK